MAIRAINILKGYFLRGLKPTEAQFGDLIDSFVHRSDTNTNLYKLQVTKEFLTVTAETTVIESVNDYTLTDTIEVLVNITEDNSFVFTPPKTFTFPYLLLANDVVRIKKFSVVPL